MNRLAVPTSPSCHWRFRPGAGTPALGHCPPGQATSRRTSPPVLRDSLASPRPRFHKGDLDGLVEVECLAHRSPGPSRLHPPPPTGKRPDLARGPPGLSCLARGRPPRAGRRLQVRQLPCRCAASRSDSIAPPRGSAHSAASPLSAPSAPGRIPDWAKFGMKDIIGTIKDNCKWMMCQLIALQQ